MLNRILFAAICILALTHSFCIADGEVEQYTVERVVSPISLPYSFSVVYRQDYITDKQRLPARGEFVPVDLYGDGNGGMYIITQNWNPGDSISSLVFYSEVERQNAIRHVNIHSSQIDCNVPYDFDGDGVVEVAITYVRHDTAFVEILGSDGDDLISRPFAEGEDNDGNGKWDGSTECYEILDINNDGYVELLLHCDSHYDLYPRKLVCLDWHNDSILWEYNIANTLTPGAFYFGPTSSEGDTAIIFSTSSKGNACTTGTMDDAHSYVVALERNGTTRWIVEAGGIFSNPNSVFIDHNGDGIPEILFAGRYSISASDTNRAKHQMKCALRSLDLNGGLVDSIPVDPGSCVRNIWLFDWNGDGNNEVFVAGQDQTLNIYDQSMQMLATCDLFTQMEFWAYEDIVGNGSRQFLVSTGDRKTLLLDHSFKPLAQFDESFAKNKTHLYRSRSDNTGLGIVLGTEDERSSIGLTVSKTPWNMVFFRKPLLASLVTFFPMALILAFVVFYSLRMRAKNKTISAARDELHHTLDELKATQDKLVAAEKFRQAKDIAGGFAHEIRNALFPARGAVGILKDLGSGSDFSVDRAIAQATRVDKSLARAIEITKTISEYAKLESLANPEAVSLSGVINDVLNANQEGLSRFGVTARLDGDCQTEVVSNSRQLYSVFNNLLLNSLDALAGTTDPGVEISWKSDSGYVAIRFKDNGCGIAEQDLPRLFDAFYSTKPDSGTGIGLSVVKRVVELYGGSISVDSRKGDGSTFTILLKEGNPSTAPGRITE